jgi:hypothetical protein
MRQFQSLTTLNQNPVQLSKIFIRVALASETFICCGSASFALLPLSSLRRYGVQSHISGDGVKEHIWLHDDAGEDES